MGNAGFALLLFLAGGVLIVIAVRGTYTDVVDTIMAGAAGNGSSEQKPVGTRKDVGNSEPTALSLAGL